MIKLSKRQSPVLGIAPLTWDELVARSALTISEVVADWHELIIPQHTMQPSTACVNEQLDPRFAASRHTTVPISHTRPSPRSPKATTHFPSHEG